jgi:hypothetical protein
MLKIIIGNYRISKLSVIIDIMFSDLRTYTHLGSPHGVINYAKCRHLKNLPVKELCGSSLSV